ncbi:DUF4240 domain-containing protein [Labrenzia sp. CE80]|uniref:DUF4240 domain-containing protein n=1 Tax=Labrenzia sp. CE80 TaxID=1788986 RepID=UPI00129B645F|nr:DUF4240 domain-containing protein [Labrenzia sp. CE80]
MSSEIQISDNESFRPRFDNIDKDFDRLLELMSELLHQQRLKKPRGKSLMDEYGGEAVKQLISAYFSQGLYEAIEQHYTYDEVSFAPPGDDILNALDRLISCDQGQRVIRILRNYLANLKNTYWWYVQKRDQGFKHEPNWLESEEHQQRAYQELIGKIEGKKSILLNVMDQAQELFLKANASQQQLARLAAERAEIQAEKRVSSAGKPDPRKMDQDVFWEVVGTPTEGGISEHIEMVVDRLARFKATEIRAFYALLHEIVTSSYRSDLWALAYLLNEGCSDDDFAAFQYGLMLQGRQIFETVLAEPDSFPCADIKVGSGLQLQDVPFIAYEMRTGKAMKRKNFKATKLQGPDWAEQDYAAHLPKVAAALGYD